MFGSEILDVAIGMALLFLFISLTCTAAMEAIEAVLKNRAKDLERGIRELLDDKDGATAKKIFDHPLLYSLFPGEYDPQKLRGHFLSAGKYMRLSGRNLPSYIPSANFAGALLDMVARGQLSTGANAAVANDDFSIESLRTTAGTMPDGRLKQAMLWALDQAGDNLDVARANLEQWFDGTMDRVSGWYKRRTQGILFAIGLTAAVALNIDALTVARELWSNTALREAAVERAKSVTAPEESTEAGQPSPAEDPLPGIDPQEGVGGQPDGAGAGTTAAQPETVVPAQTVSPGAAPPDGSVASPPAADAQPAASTPAASPQPTSQPGGNDQRDDRTAEIRDRILGGEEKPLRAQLQEIGYPMGWDQGWPAPQRTRLQCRSDPDEISAAKLVPLWQGEWLCFENVNLRAPTALATGLGWFITALAAMLGAPFWFDILNKFMVIRATVKPTEKSPDESSEDRQSSSPAKVVGAPSGSSPSPAFGAMGAARLAFKPHEWKSGTEDGIL